MKLLSFPRSTSTMPQPQQLSSSSFSRENICLQLSDIWKHKTCQPWPLSPSEDAVKIFWILCVSVRGSMVLKFTKASTAFAEHVCSTSMWVGNVKNFLENPRLLLIQFHAELEVPNMLDVFAIFSYQCKTSQEHLEGWSLQIERTKFFWALLISDGTKRLDYPQQCPSHNHYHHHPHHNGSES